MSHDVAEPSFGSDHVASGNPDMVPLLTHYKEMWETSAAPFYTAVFESTGLDVRVRELIAIALLSMKGWEAGLQFHARAALDAGVDPDDIRGAILATIGIDGVATASRGILWFESYLRTWTESNGQDR
jgi:AhpD family alkylhydroperoxidase